MQIQQIREYEALISSCNKENAIRFLSTIFGKNFGGKEEHAAEGISIIGSVTFDDTDGRPKPVLCCFKAMEKNLTERSSRRKQFDDSVKVLKQAFTNPYMGNGPVNGVFTQGLFFFCDDNGNFRLSLVTSEIANGKHELNNYRRQSFFVESGAQNNTFRHRLCKRISNFVELKEAFNVEKLSDDFFREYKVFYEDIVQYITGVRFIEDKKSYKREELSAPCDEIFDQFVESYETTENAEKAVRNYVKKLMGRLVFVQFLQKKGWLGISAEKSGWKGGDTCFLQNLFKNASDDEKNDFIDTVLEDVLFYAFNTKESDRKFKNKLLKQYKFPFLNGGLFEMDGDDKLKFALPAEAFHNENNEIALTERKNIYNKKWAKKRKPYFNKEACGLFDFFDRYNFTIDENDPTDAEVSVDPEMLGKIFENLLEDNKDKGAFYTPKEIVNYMVNESLIAYLETESSTSLRAKGEAIQSSSRSGLEPESIRNFVLTQDASAFTDDEKTLLNTKLAEVKICDPAIGSGAFPMGILNVLVKCRRALSDLPDEKNALANFKRHIIQNNIYGVDIEKGAVDIARLRFWLSLVVDEEAPEALPNLDFKIMQGNSLLECYEGIDLSDISGEKGNRKETHSKKIQTSMVFDKKEAIEQIQKDLSKFYKTDNHLEKESLTLSINENVKQYIKHIAIEQIKEKNKNIERDKLEKEIERKSNKIDLLPVPNDKFFLWHTYFRDVFDETKKGKSVVGGGFDIVIGNPPYGVSIKGDYRSAVVNELGKAPDFEIYYYFLIVASRLLRKNGLVSYIIPNTWLFNMFASAFRKDVCAKWNIVEVLDCSKFEIFENATVRNSIVFWRKPDKIINRQFFYKSTADAENFAQLVNQNKSIVDKEDLLKMNQNWGLAFKLSPKTIQIVNKISNTGMKLSHYYPEISQGLIAYDKYKGQSEKVIKNKAYHHSQFKPGLKSWLWGEDVRRYSVRWNGKEWLDYCKGIANPRQPHFFTKKRLLVREITNPSIYAAITEEELYNDPAIIIVLDNDSYPIKVVLAILNSKMATFFHFNHSPKATKGSFPKILVQDIKDFPIPSASKEDQQDIIDLVDKILTAQKADPQEKTSDLELQIDKLVYKLYDLTGPEIDIIEKSFAQAKEKAENNTSSKTKTTSQKKYLEDSDEEL